MKDVTILLKKLKDNLTPEEETLFQIWLKDSNKNSTFYRKLLQLKNEGQTAHKISELDINNAWEAVQTKVKLQQKDKLVPFYNKKWWRYSAAASIVLLISLGFLFNRENNTNNNIVEPTIVKSTIEAGTNKATLTLENGTSIVLEKGNTIQTQNANSNGEEIIYNAGKKNLKKITHNYLTIPRGGQFFIKLSDGTKVWLNSESQLKYPTAFKEGETRIVELVYGEAYFEVSPSTDHKGSKFKVFNQSQEIEVLGTEFNIKAYKDEANIYTTLVEGKVVVSNGASKQNLVPNQQSNFDTKTNNITVAEVDVNSEISWKNGVFSFKEKPLKDIMKLISRWYDVDVVFVNKDLENIRFNGELGKDQNIEDVLLTIKNLSVIKDYQIKNKTIILK